MDETIVAFNYYTLSKFNSHALIPDDLIESYNLIPLSHILVAIYPNLYICKVIPSGLEVPCFGTMVAAGVLSTDETRFRSNKATIIKQIELPEITSAELLHDSSADSLLPHLKTMLAGVAFTTNSYITIGNATLQAKSSGVLRMNNRLIFQQSKTSIKLPIPMENVQLPKYCGNSNHIDTLKKIIRSSLFEAESFANSTLTPPNAALITGPPGIGKTLLIESVCKEMNVICKTINPGSIISEDVTQSQKKLSEIVESAILSSIPIVIVFDNIDLLAPVRSDNASSYSIVATLLTLFDGADTSKLCFFATSRDRFKIDPAIYRAGRIDHLIELSAPTERERLQILESLLPEDGLNFKYDLADVASNTSAYTGSDLKSLVTKAISKNSFVDALKMVKPSLSRSSQKELPMLSLNDFAGFKEVKDRVVRAVHWPILKEEVLLSLGLKPTTGVLITGPSGSGKTRLAICAARDLGTKINVFMVRGPELYGSYYGESERNLQHLYDQARRSAPAIVIIDDITAVVANRAHDATNDDTGVRMLTTLLQLMDGIASKPGVFTIATATNVDDIDEALLRPGRFDDIIELNAPSPSDLDALNSYYASKYNLPESSIDSIIEKHPNPSSSDIDFFYRQLRSDITIIQKNISSSSI